MPRLFAAIDFPSAITRQVIAICQGIADAKWIEPENIHLTLKFIGEVTPEQAESLKHALGQIRANAFDIKLSGIGTFPVDDARRPKVLWAAVEAGPELHELQLQICQASELAGIETKREVFNAHVTLARFKRPPHKDLETWRQLHAGFESAQVRVSHFRLMSSQLTSTGPLYKTESSYTLT